MYCPKIASSSIILFTFIFFISAGIFIPPETFSREITPNLYKVMIGGRMPTIIKESSRSPVVAIQIWVKAGSSYESRTQWGITHLIEHMIFKGTDTRRADEIGGAIEAVGGTINAYTSLDYTVYHCVVPKQFWREALDILTDAVLHARFDSDALEKEKKVVLEEIGMRDDQPSARLSRLLMKTAYGHEHPYGHPVIGYPETVASFSRKDLVEYVKKRYLPENMTCIVVGDIDASQVLPAIKEDFKAFLESSPSPGVESNTAPPPTVQTRLAFEEMDTKEAYVAIAFHGVPSFPDDETPIFDVLGAILGEGESSRLVRQLKNRLGLVHGINAYAFTPRLHGLFEITMTLDPDKTQEAFGQLLQELFKLKREGVLDEELERAKTMVETDFVYDQERMEGEARKLGVFQVLGQGPEDMTRYLERVKKVTAEDIQRVANKIFTTKGVTVAMVMPNGKGGGITREDISVMLREAELQAGGMGFADNVFGPVRLVRKAELSNGITVIVREVPEVPTVAIRMVFPGGVRYETKENNGIFHFLAAAWTKGTETHSAEGLSDMIEGLGASIGGFSGRNTFGLSGRFLSSNFAKGLDIFAEILLTPTFPQDEVEKLKSIVVAQIRRQDDYLPSVAMRAFNRLLFSPHPYSMDTLGTVDSVTRLDSKALHKLYSEFAIPERAVLSVVGDVDADELIATLETLLGGWKPEDHEILPELPTPMPLDSPKITSISRQQKEQTHIVLGFKGPTLASEDRYPMEVLNAVLSGMGGRLFMDLRDKQALAYHVTSMVGLGLDYGSFALYIACSPEKKNRALKGLWKEVYRVLQEPVGNEELERARRWLIGRYEIGLQTNGAQAMDMALNELYGLGYNFGSRYIQQISKVTPQEILDVAKKYMNQDAYVLVTVGP